MMLTTENRSSRSTEAARTRTSPDAATHAAVLADTLTLIETVQLVQTILHEAFPATSFAITVTKRGNGSQLTIDWWTAPRPAGRAARVAAAGDAPCQRWQGRARRALYADVVRPSHSPSGCGSDHVVAPVQRSRDRTGAGASRVALRRSPGTGRSRHDDGRRLPSRPPAAGRGHRGASDRRPSIGIKRTGGRRCIARGNHRRSRLSPLHHGRTSLRAPRRPLTTRARIET